MEHIPATAGTAETQTLSPHLSIRWCGSSHCPVIVTLSPWHITDKDGILQNIEIFTALHAPEQITTIEENGRIIVSTPPATTTRLTLEDGSHVLLSANSRLEYPKEFSSQGSRTVNLTGEARFEVTKDAHRPFIVSADKMQTQVLGTVFDVNAYPGNAPAVTLYQGRVKVGKAASPIEKEIVPGQCATLTTSGDIRLAKATRTEKEGCTKDEFYYDNTEMITVLQNIGPGIISASSAILQTFYTNESISVSAGMFR